MADKNSKTLIIDIIEEHDLMPGDPMKTYTGEDIAQSAVISENMFASRTGNRVTLQRTNMLLGETVSVEMAYEDFQALQACNLD